MSPPRRRPLADPPRGRLALPLCLLAALWLSATRVAAEPASTPAASESAEYTKSVEAALEEYRLGHYEEARSLFERAHSLEPSARTLRGLGMVEFELRHYVQALALLEQSRASTTKPLAPEQRRAVEELLARTRQFIVRYTLALTPADARAQISVDGSQTERDERGQIALVAGEHRLQVEADGYAPLELKLDSKGGEQRTLRLVLTPRAASVLAREPPRPRTLHPYRKLGIALTALGGALIAGGGALDVVAWSKANDAPTRDGPAADRAHALALAGDIGLAIGAASVITGVVLLLQRRREARIESLAPQLRVRF